MSDLGTAKGRIVIDTKDVKRAAKEVKAASQEMTKALNFIGVGVGVEAVRRLGEMAFELAKTAAEAQETREAFNALAESFDQNADDMLSAMRTASKGMISDADLVLAANNAMLLGVADNTEKLTALLEVAEVRGDAMGISIKDAFDKLVTGLGRVSPRVLQQIGIKGGQEALDAYAESVGRTASELSDAQKQAILFNFVMASSKTLLDANAGAALSAADKFEQFGAKVDNTKQQLGDFLLAAGATDALHTFSTAIDDSIKQIEQMDRLLGELKTLFAGFGQSTGLAGYLAEVQREVELLSDSVGHLGWMIGQGSLIAFGTRMGFRADDPLATNITTSGPKSRPSPGGARGGASGPVPIPATPIDQKAVDKAQAEYGKNLAKITRDTNRDIQQATEDAGRQRAETIRSYELGIAREEEDFLIQRARQQRDYEASIVQIMRDAQRRDARIQADLADQIGEAQKDSNKRLAQQEKDFQKQRQRAQEDFSDNLLDAAGDLDAKRVYQLGRDNAKAQKRAQEDHDEQIKQERESLAERIEEAQKAAQKQLDDAREADAQRLEDMRAALELQRADEDADRELRRTRGEEDQAHALEQQEIEAGLRIQQIIDNAADERTALQDAFNQQLQDLHLHNLAYEAEQKRQQKQAIEDLKPFMRDWFNSQAEAMAATMQGPATKWPSFGGMQNTLNTLPVSGGGTGGSTYNSRAFNPVVNLTITGGSSLTESELERAIHDALMKVFEETS